MNTTLYKKILSLSVCIGFSILSVLSQTPVIDQLKDRLDRQTKTDTAKINLLNKLGYELCAYDIKKRRYMPISHSQWLYSSTTPKEKPLLCGFLE